VKKIIASGLLVLLLLAGCAPRQDVFLESVSKSVAQTVFDEEISNSSGCIQLSGIFCQQPLYDLSFAAPADTDVKLACNDFVKLATNLGAVAYSTNYGDGKAFKLSIEKTEVLDFCASALGTALKDGDGSSVYQGLLLHDDGENDGVGKLFTLSRGVQRIGDERYSLTIAFSRDINRIGPINYGTEKPKLMTQAELDANNAQNSVAIETMKTANTLQGLTETKAIALIEAAGYTWVVVDRDGKELPTDASYIPTRVRLIIREGVVYDAVAGYLEEYLGLQAT
jgi:hypothetical protein